MERERIQLSDPNEWVAVKKVWSWGDMKAVEKARREANLSVSSGPVTAAPEDAASLVEQYGPEIVSSGMAFGEMLLQRLIVEWSFRDSAGASVPISPESMENLLSADDVATIMLRCIELGPKRVAKVANEATGPNSSTV